MKKTLYSFILIGLFLNGSIAACGAPLDTEQQPEIETVTSTAAFTKTATIASTTTEPLLTATATQAFAPFCDPDPASPSPSSACQLPLAEEGTSFCTKKNPYTVFFTNPGVTFESITEGFECSDAGIQDGRQVVTCTGPMASTFGVNICDPACAVPTVQADLTQCPGGYVYDNLRGCCSQFFQPANQNCEVLTLETKSCVVDCSEYTKRAACDRNANACEWNQAEKLCQLRR